MHYRIAAGGAKPCGARKRVRLPKIRCSRRSDVSTRRFRRSVCLPEDASTALYWTAAGMLEAKKSCRRLKADKQLPALKAALSALQAARSAPVANDSGLASMSEAA